MWVFVWEIIEVVFLGNLETFLRFNLIKVLERSMVYGVLYCYIHTESCVVFFYFCVYFVFRSIDVVLW